MQHCGSGENSFHVGVCEYVCIVSNVRMCTACRHACIGHNGYVIVLNVHFLMRPNKPETAVQTAASFSPAFTYYFVHVVMCALVIMVM